MEEIKYYICTKCKQEKPSTDFFKNGKHKITGKLVRARCKICCITKEDSRKASLKRRYGISLEFYNIVLKDQDNSCAICKTTDPGYESFCVDHCHKTGKIRGLLCRKCNIAIGHLQDDPILCIRASKYLING